MGHSPSAKAENATRSHIESHNRLNKIVIAIYHDLKPESPTFKKIKIKKITFVKKILKKNHSYLLKKKNHHPYSVIFTPTSKHVIKTRTHLQNRKIQYLEKEPTKVITHGV